MSRSESGDVLERLDAIQWRLDRPKRIQAARDRAAEAAHPDRGVQGIGYGRRSM